MSLGSSQSSSILHDAIKSAVAQGTYRCSAAAGNDYRSAVSYPAAYPETVAVSATDIPRSVGEFFKHRK